MLKLLGQRLLLSVVALIVVSALIFAVTEWLPGDVAANILGRQATPENVAALRAELRLDRPAPQRYVAWLRGALRGDFGTSLANQRPVLDIVAARLPNTLFLLLYAALVAVPLSLLLGTLAAACRGSVFDRLVGIAGVATISTPDFLAGLILMLLFAVHYQWFPAIATFKPEHALVGRLHDLFLPMLALALMAAAQMTRMVRSVVLEVMDKPYIETASLKGLSRARIVMHHAMPNALAPVIDMLALNLACLAAGVVVVEAVFNYNGLGRSMVDAVANRDLPVVQACGLIFAAAVIGLRLAADLLAIASDPRLRRSR